MYFIDCLSFDDGKLRTAEIERWIEQTIEDDASRVLLSLDPFGSAQGREILAELSIIAKRVGSSRQITDLV